MIKTRERIELHLIDPNPWQPRQAMDAKRSRIWPAASTGSASCRFPWGVAIRATPTGSSSPSATPEWTASSCCTSGANGHRMSRWTWPRSPTRKWR